MINSWNYLRMRGEYITVDSPGDKFVELPPHARRIPIGLVIATSWSGTTSACAENTRRCRHDPAFSRNYLRMRGEYTIERAQQAGYTELPPHARRIPIRTTRFNIRAGTTSACAENTLQAW